MITVINNIKIIKDTGKRTRDRGKIYQCICHCGKSFESNRLARVYSCGCSRIKDIVGQKFGRLLAIDRINEKDSNGKYKYKYLCDCGKIIITNRITIKSKTKSCGCLGKEVSAELCRKKSGKNHHWYNHELKDEDRKTRKSCEQYSFRNEVYRRDNYTCQKCFKYGGFLNAHHLDAYHWAKDLRSDPNNGITLCKVCHRKFHKIYGTKYNTKEQMKEFLYA